MPNASVSQYRGSGTTASCFWRSKSLAAMSKVEWESLCDGCGRCCLHKLEDDETGEIHYTNVACQLLDIETCRCRRYGVRHWVMHDCVRLTPKTAGRLSWLPSTCAYRLLADGKDLPAWHPLVTGDPESTHQAGMSVRGRAIAEETAGELDQHIVSDLA